MKARLLMVLKLGLLSLVFALAAPPRAQACSGDDCGCYIQVNQCVENCYGDMSCIRECRAEGRRCAICCCCSQPYCPSYCTPFPWASADKDHKEGDFLVAAARCSARPPEFDVADRRKAPPRREPAKRKPPSTKRG